MNFAKIFSFVLLMTALVVGGGNGTFRSDSSGINNWVNSPDVEFAANGDRTSHYPPYYHPTN